MEPHVKSNSFTFKRNIFKESFNSKTRNCRTKLQDRFNDSETSKSSSDKTNRSILSLMSLTDTRRALRTGTEKISRTFSELRTTLGSFSQRFRVSTKRRQILEEGPVTPGCATPHAFSRALLGRTPTKLYSPFSIESPYNKPLSKSR